MLNDSWLHSAKLNTVESEAGKNNFGLGQIARHGPFALLDWRGESSFVDVHSKTDFVGFVVSTIYQSLSATRFAVALEKSIYERSATAPPGFSDPAHPARAG